MLLTQPYDTENGVLRTAVCKLVIFIQHPSSNHQAVLGNQTKYLYMQRSTCLLVVCRNIYVWRTRIYCPVRYRPRPSSWPLYWMELAKSSVVVVLGLGSNDLGPPENGLVDRLGMATTSSFGFISILHSLSFLLRSGSAASIGG